jgi:hypothetical protein
VGVFQPLMHATISRVIPLAALIGTLAYAPASFAQPVGDAARATARQFALEGVAAHGRADWPAVIDRFERAEQLFHAPVHLRYLAIAYERSVPPNMVRAAETWQRLSQEQLPADAPQVFRDAVAEARRELERIDGRIGRLAVEVSATLQGATVTLDGQEVPASALGSVRYVDAGPHTLRAQLTGRPDVERSINVAPGATERVQLDAPAPVVEAPVVVPPRTTTVLRPNPLRTVGIITASVGGAALLGGVITGLMASSEFDQLALECPMMRCATQAQLDRRNSVDSLATTSTALYISGGVLIAAGVALFFVGKPREETVQLTLGPRYAGVSFAF